MKPLPANIQIKNIPQKSLSLTDSNHSFVFHKDTSLFERRSSKLMTTVVSTFTAYYVSLWSAYFPDKPLTSPLPTFDGRCVCYPSVRNLRDYMSWRQADCKFPNALPLLPQTKVSENHGSVINPMDEWLTFECSLEYIGHINNQFNTTFWALIQLAGLTNQEAEQKLSVCILSNLATPTPNLQNITTNQTAPQRAPSPPTKTKSSSN